MLEKEPPEALCVSWGRLACQALVGKEWGFKVEVVSWAVPVRKNIRNVEEYAAMASGANTGTLPRGRCLFRPPQLHKWIPLSSLLLRMQNHGGHIVLCLFLSPLSSPGE